jgi:HTH-type transcriptional regulator / antitoxin HigA
VNRFDPDWVIAPGETLREWFEANHLPLSVGEHYGLDQRTLAGIFVGKRKITKPIAQKLCNLTQVGAPFWLALEHNFRVGLASGKTWAK